MLLRGKDKERIVKEHKITEWIPWSETCFGCNDGMNEGIGMRCGITEDGYVVGFCRTKTGHQGFPNTVHGGLVSAYLDEVLWHATRQEKPDTIAMTVEMTVRYFRPVDIGADIRVIAEPAEREGRHIYVNGYVLLSDNTVAATARIHYVTVRQNSERMHAEKERIKYTEALTDKEQVWF